MERQFKDSDKAVERHGKRGGKAGEKERNDSGKRQRLFTAFPQTSAATLLKTETPFRALLLSSCPTNGAFPRTPAAIRCDRPWTGRENSAEVLKKGKGKAVEGQQNIGGQAVETQ